MYEVFLFSSTASGSLVSKANVAEDCNAGSLFGEFSQDNSKGSIWGISRVVSLAEPQRRV
jgi:hypothetical protein